MVKIFETKGFSAKDLVELAKDPTITVSSTPFGAEPGSRKIIIKKAVPWKGLKGEALRKAFPKIYENAKRLGEISKLFSGEAFRGNCIVYNPYRRRYEVMPVKAAEMMRAKNPSVEIIELMPSKARFRQTLSQWENTARTYAQSVTAGTGIRTMEQLATL